MTPQNRGAPRSHAAVIVAAFFFLAAPVAFILPVPRPAPPRAEPVSSPESTQGPQRLVRNGVVVEFSLLHPGDTSGPRRPLMEGDEAEVRLRMTDASSGLPLRGLSPSAWMDRGHLLPDKTEEQQECKERVGVYLKGLVGIRPLIDLNSYYLLVLNKDPSISVIDPVVGMTGKTSLYATVVLDRPGADWVRSLDQKKLYVSMPRAGAVAVVDTETFRVEARVQAGQEPTRVALQPDGHYLWIGNDASEPARSGVTVMDTRTLKPAASIATGRGHHEIVFSSDDRYAFVSNRDEGTVSVISIARLEKIKDLKAGALPISLAYSPLSQVLYVADGKEGRVTAFDGERLEEVARLSAKPGLGPMRFSQDGRWGLIVNPAEHVVYVVDAAENQLVHAIPVSGQPYQVSFTRAFAYVRLLDSERVEMINLSTLGRGKQPTVNGFAAGQGAPRLSGDLSIADSISPASTEAAVFVASPAENTTYFYMEGMNAPMGSFGNYGHNVRAVQVVDRSLREVEPGVYSARLRLPVAGQYDVAFLLDAPRVLHCFRVEAKVNPALKKDLGALEIEYLDAPAPLAVGQRPLLRFRLRDASTHEPSTGLEEVKVLTYAAPGRRRAEVTAREVGEGVYEVDPALSGAGAYYLYVSVPELKLKYGDLPYRTLWVGGTVRSQTKREEQARDPQAN
jgi:YVTN family beta-propeller protein